MERRHEIVMLTPDELRDNPRNPRTHSKSLIDSLRHQFLNGVGYRDPIEVDESNVILAGHARKKALLACDIGRVRGAVDGKVPVIRYLDLTVQEKIAYTIAANKEQEKSSWDADALKVLLSDESLATYDIALTGFTSEEITNLLSPPTQDSHLSSESVSKYEVLITDLNEEQQIELIGRLTEEGYKCRALIL